MRIHRKERPSELDDIKRRGRRFYKVSFCTTCKDRGSHLKKTLPRNIKDNIDYPDVEFVVLDYNSNDGITEWILRKFKKETASGMIKIYQTKTPENFHMSNAKNLAHLNAEGGILCNLDADNYTGRDFAFYLNHVFCENRNVILSHWKYGKRFNKKEDSSGKRDGTGEKKLFDKIKESARGTPGFAGRIAISKENFYRLGGYDESFTGWGLEDADFFKRATRLKLKNRRIPSYFLRSLYNKDGRGEMLKKREEADKNRVIFQENDEREIVRVRKRIDIRDVKRVTA